MLVELMKTAELPMVTQLVQLEQEAFGVGGMNEWHLVPLIRYGRVFVAKENGAVIGSIQYMREWDRPTRAYLVGVSIAEKFRGKGFGTKLIGVTLQELRKENITEIELTVDPENRAAINIYSDKFGFVEVSTNLNEYGEGENRLVMVLTLGERDF